MDIQGTYLHARRWILSILFVTLAVCRPLPGGVHARAPDPDIRSVPAVVFENGALKLVGTAVARNPQHSVAVIEDQENRRQRLVHEGDRAGRMMIKRILRDQVVIDAGNGEKSVKIGIALAKGWGLPSAGNESSAATAAGKGIGSRQRRYAIQHKTARAAFADPEKVLDDIEITPGRLFNRKTGFRIAAFGPESIFSEIGLRSGDLVLGINGREITGPEKAAAVFKTIGDGGEIDLQVRRRARTYRIRLQVR